MAYGTSQLMLKEAAPPPTPPPQGRGVVCEVTPIELLIRG